ncbi:YsnF/AvaK domain-containing protein [Paracoccus marcusii]|uniref:YsnF/AvaK domain-containing protein n=1 Tax=Paracoccus marcusii TaxID=59779 RepID=UPI0035A6F7A6
MTYDNEAGTSNGSMSVSAMFDTNADAQNAVSRLETLGISRTQIRTVEGAAQSTEQRASTSDDKGFWDSLGDFFFPDEDRYTYAEGLSRGGVLVTVTGLTAAHYDQVLDILDDEGTVDLAEREESWRSEGWGGYEVSPHVTGARTVGSAVGADGSYADTSSKTGDESIPIVEEQLRVGKRDTSHGRVRVRAYTVEEPVSETVNLREDRVELERRPVDRAVTDVDTAFQDRTVEAEEFVEEAVVSKEARVVEEVSLRKTSDTRQETVTDSVRHTEVEIDDERSDTPRTTR